MMHRPLFALALSFFLAPDTIRAQNLLERTLANDTMPNLVPNPGFEEVERTYCAWTTDAAKFNAAVTAWKIGRASCRERVFSSV